MEKSIINEVDRIKKLMLINESTPPGNTWIDVLEGLKLLVGKKSGGNKIDEFIRDFKAGRLSSDGLLNKLSIMSITLSDDTFKKFFETILQGLDRNVRQQINDIVNATRKGDMELDDAQYALRMIGQTDEIDDMMLKYLDLNKKITKSTDPSILDPYNRIPTTEDIINKLRAKFANDKRAQEFITKAESNLRRYIPKSKGEAEEIIKNNEELIKAALGNPSNWQKVKNYMINNWATKMMAGFFTALGVTAIFMVTMKAFGLSGLTPIKNFLIALGFDDMFEHLCNSGYQWACKGYKALTGQDTVTEPSDTIPTINLDDLGQ